MYENWNQSRIVGEKFFLDLQPWHLFFFNTRFQVMDLFKTRGRF
jgi:hypothetical protein